jgi:hypothetical protein
MACRIVFQPFEIGTGEVHAADELVRARYDVLGAAELDPARGSGKPVVVARQCGLQALLVDGPDAIQLPGDVTLA